jgi:uncharacterized protein CbrC (UPF0167 family)
VSTGPSILETITTEDLEREGFTGWTQEQFVTMFREHNGCSGTRKVNRIEFEYLNKPLDADSQSSRVS